MNAHFMSLKSVKLHENPPKKNSCKSLVKSYRRLLELLEKGLRLEVLGHKIVKAGDNFVNLLFPRRVQILAGQDRFEEFLQGLLHHPTESVRHLKSARCHNPEKIINSSKSPKNLKIA